MEQIIRKQVRVGAGGLIEIRDPSLVEGARAEVIVLLGENLEGEAQEAVYPFQGPFGAADWMFAAPGGRDGHGRALHDEWD